MLFIIIAEEWDIKILETVKYFDYKIKITKRDYKTKYVYDIFRCVYESPATPLSSKES